MLNDGLVEDLKRGAEFIRSIDKSEVVRLISHLDADGLCSASIIISALTREGFRYNLSIANQLREPVLEELSKESNTYYIFTDLGSGQLELIEKFLKGKRIIILDHHSFETDLEKSLDLSNVIHINPHRHGYDGNLEISGSGITYLFARQLNPANIVMAHIAIIGAIGDVQENQGFTGLNTEILADAVKSGKLKVTDGIRWFGIETKPLVKLLSYNTEPKVPGVSGSETKAVMFLNEIGIPPQQDGRWRRFADLNEDERQRLISAVIMKRVNEEKPEDIFGKRYLLTDEEDSSPTKDAREFSTLLNSCGRMEMASYGIGTCLGDRNSRERAIDNLREYRRKIMDAIKWYEQNSSSPDIIKGDGYLIINARDSVIPTIIGTLASVISNSENIQKGIFILSMARSPDDTTKVSLRMNGDGEKHDLRDIIAEIVKEVKGEFGGHKNAAGAYIQTGDEEKFIETAKKVLGKFSEVKA